MLSYTVAQRRAEIGIRMAVGAGPWQMVRMVTLGGLRLAAGGTVIGLAAAWMMTRLYTTLLFHVSPLDPLTYTATAAGIVLVALLACAVPAIRAARVDPLRSLQHN